jgi:5-methylcytosine-specific restriction enzyme subunit McrC
VNDPTPIKNLLRIAFYGGGYLEELEECDAGTEEGAGFYELLARMVANAGMRIRRGGYQRGYIEQQEMLSRPRGRALWARSIASGSLAAAQLWCSFDDLCEDAPDNRVLKATVERLLASEDACSFDEEVVLALELLRSDLREVPCCRLNSHLLASLPKGPSGRRYRVVRYCAKLMVERSEPDGEGSGHQAVQLLQDHRLMRRVFERFVYRFASRSKRRGERVSRPTYRWQAEEGQDAMVPALKPDVVLQSGRQALVVECKYTERCLENGQRGGAKLRSDHLQQLYCYLARQPRRGMGVRGLLLYPRVGQAMRVEMDLGEFPVTVTTLDLAQPWSELTVCLLRDLGLGPA